MREITVAELNKNAITLIGKEWMLITAGNEADGYNTMTASWGHLGEIWGEPTSVIYIRPQRYTKEFVDSQEMYTLTFFPAEHKEKLAYLGSHSGRNEDKVAKVGLTPVFEKDYTYFAEASLTLVCRKLYRAPLTEEGFFDSKIVESCYPDKDFHDMYVGEIVKILVNE